MLTVLKGKRAKEQLWKYFLKTNKGHLFYISPCTSDYMLLSPAHQGTLDRARLETYTQILSQSKLGIMLSIN